MSKNNVKPGYKTTEFWVSLIAQILGILLVMGVITPEQKSALVEATSQISGALVMAFSAFGYSLSRGKAKGGAAKDE